MGSLPREGSLRVARPAGADSRRREAGVLGGHADERRQRRCPAGRQPFGTPRPGRSASLRLLERAPPCRRRRASRPIPGRWRRARDPRGARPLARPKPRACLRNRPAAVGFAQPSVGLRVYGCGQRSEDVQLRWPAAARSRPGLAPLPQRTTAKPRLSLRRNILRGREGASLSRSAGKARRNALFALRGPFPAPLVNPLAPIAVLG